jgi:hypothetical protein
VTGSVVAMAAPSPLRPVLQADCEREEEEDCTLRLLVLVSISQDRAASIFDDLTRFLMVAPPASCKRMSFPLAPLQLARRDDPVSSTRTDCQSATALRTSVKCPVRIAYLLLRHSPTIQSIHPAYLLPLESSDPLPVHLQQFLPSM